MDTRALDQIISVIKPTTVLERDIVSSSAFIVGALWGAPRPGHPEGSVINHIGDVLKNISDNRMVFGGFPFANNKKSPYLVADLRIVAILHDTFKHQVDRTKPRSGENHHGMIARRFAENYILSSDVLDVIELHDEAYNAWQKGSRKGRWDLAEDRARKLIDRLGRDNIGLYMAFYLCDNSTGNKPGEPYQWFLKIVEKEFSPVQIKSCTSCMYSDNGRTSCFRLMPYAQPKIDISKGIECAHNGYAHYLPFDAHGRLKRAAI